MFCWPDACSCSFGTQKSFQSKDKTWTQLHRWESGSTSIAAQSRQRLVEEPLVFFGRLVTWSVMKSKRSIEYGCCFTKKGNPKNHWILLWRGLDVYSRGLGSSNHQFWDPMIVSTPSRSWKFLGLSEHETRKKKHAAHGLSSPTFGYFFLPNFPNDIWASHILSSLRFLIRAFRWYIT